MKNDNVPLRKIDKIFKDYIGENESLNVATENIPSVIESVLKLGNKVANKLPSRQTVDNTVCEKVAIGQKHIGVKLGQQKNLCLYGDERRKKGKTYQTFLASNEEKEVFCLGLRDMHNKAASTLSKKFSMTYHLLVRK